MHARLKMGGVCWIGFLHHPVIRTHWRVPPFHSASLHRTLYRHTHTQSINTECNTRPEKNRSDGGFVRAGSDFIRIIYAPDAFNGKETRPSSGAGPGSTRFTLARFVYESKISRERERREVCTLCSCKTVLTNHVRTAAPVRLLRHTQMDAWKFGQKI